MVAAVPALEWGTTWPDSTDSEPLRTLWGSPGAVTGHSIYNNNFTNIANTPRERPYGPPAAGSVELQMAPMAAAAIVAILAVEWATVAARAALSVAPVHAERPVSIGQRGL